MAFCTEAWNKGTEHGLGGEKFTKIVKCVVPKISYEENAHKFSDTDSIVHWEFHPEGQTITAAHYTHIMEWLLIWRNWEGLALYWSKGWFLLHSHVPSHNAATVKHILAARKVAVLHNPPYSPNLAPANYFILPQIQICPERSEIQLHNRYSRSGYRETQQHYKSFLEWIKKLHECAIRCIKTR
jgi:hypothetical protein